ncbi:hypothetical protein KEM56_002249 [Ascosphaera pollenicola]|nr:hypothetical protein KEM56_002249 [Ascosphaera pollenicola]
MEPLIAITGSTGTGKSQLAVDLASRFNGEIINADVMQTYRGLPITTNQVQPHEMNGIPHHLIAINSLEQEPWQVGMFRRECLKTIKEIRSRGNLPVLVGGTHYYTQAVLFNEPLVDTRGTEDAPEAAHPKEGERPLDAAERERFDILDRSPAEVLDKLREVDPVMASRWHPNEDRKIRRSLEIYLQTGRRASDIYDEQRKQKQSMQENVDVALGSLRFPTVIFWVHSASEVLKNRLNTRVDGMEKRGLVAEAEVLFNYLQEKKQQGVDVDRTRGVWVSIGFKELEPYFEALRAGEHDDEYLSKLKQTCLESVKSSTRKYAKQQIKWVRGKLWNGLVAANAENRLFVVDTTDPSNWDHDALGPAERITAAFLNNKPLISPLEVSAFAKETLQPLWDTKASSASETPLHNVTCDVCRVTVLSGPQWQGHVESARHRRCVKLAEKRAEMYRNNPHYRAAREARARSSSPS